MFVWERTLNLSVCDSHANQNSSSSNNKKKESNYNKKNVYEITELLLCCRTSSRGGTYKMREQIMTTKNSSCMYIFSQKKIAFVFIIIFIINFQLNCTNIYEIKNYTVREYG